MPKRLLLVSCRYVDLLESYSRILERYSGTNEALALATAYYAFTLHLCLSEVNDRENERKRERER